MKNRFNATCANCGMTVLVGDGDTNLNGFGRWVTKHAVCPPKVQRPSYIPPSIHFDDDPEFYEDLYYGMTSEDFNPNEGDK